MVVNFADKGNHQIFKRHLKKISWIYRHKTKTIIILNNVRCHHSQLLKTFLAKHKKLEFLYLPAYLPDLNPIESLK